MIVDLFSGPRGWSEGLRPLGLTDMGIEIDPDAHATATAAGHVSLLADVETVDPIDYAGTVGLIASPPCPDFSTSGKRAGRQGASGRLVDEPVRWVSCLRPKWIACEQVPPALKVWREHCAIYEGMGYSTWCGILNAADFGVPQIRKRAVLMARYGRKNWLAPEPTHHPRAGAGRARWVPMNSVVDCEAVNTGRDWKIGGSRIDAQTIPASGPAPTFTAKSGSQWWLMNGDEHRSLTVSEALAIQSFRPDYPVQGSLSKQWEQIGNAVPPLLAEHVLRQLAVSAHEAKQ